MDKTLSYYKRDFNSIKEELVNFVKRNYGDIWKDFNDNSIGMMLLEVHASLGDMLSYNQDRLYNELNLDNAQLRKTVFSIAKTYGLKIPPKRPSVTLVDFTLNIPVKGDSFDIDYCPVIVRNAQISGGGVIFETVYDIDFASPYNQNGNPNRTIVPFVDNNNVIKYYQITKRELVVNGQSKFFKKTITSDDSIPFLEIVLPDANVLEVVDVVSLDNDGSTSLPTLSQWYDTKNRWEQVEALIQDKIFKHNAQIETDNNKILSGKWITQDKRYTLEYTDKGYSFLTFGNGNKATVDNLVYNSNDTLLDELKSISNTFYLGEVPKINTNLFIRYKVGGGTETNVGVNVLNTINDVNVIVYGTNNELRNFVKNSLRVNNPIPAIGGADELTTSDIKHLISYNFASQNRGVTLNDYYALIQKMNGKFGKPHKVSLALNDNKINVIIVNIDENQQLSNISTKTIKDNIVEYLSNYRMINDYIEVVDGKIINIGIEVDLLINRLSDTNTILNETINNIYEFFNPINIHLSENIYVSDIISKIKENKNVLSIIDVRFLNKVGGIYSLNKITNHTISSEGFINISNTQTLISAYDEIFEIKYKNNDIKIKLFYQ